MKKKKETSTLGKNKVITGIMERVELAAIIETVEKSGLVKLVKYYNIEEIMKESLSISNANGTFQKLQKSKFIQKLNLMPIDPRVCVAIVGMGMV